jgi:CubicO group peptidase (beta-lactamase class C family)
MWKEVQALAEEWGVTAIVVANRQGVLAEWGAVQRPVNVRSIRKSLLGGLYGAASLDKTINLGATLSELAIDDREPALTDQERQATLRDLLMSRSGVYHEAAYEPLSMKAERPMRGAHAPGAFWFYNNWDFNVLGVIYEKITGENIYQSFDQRIAKPISMEHFSPSDSRPVFDPVSDHPAHTFSISASDLVRFGLLYLNGGIWEGRTIIPAPWISESLVAHSKTNFEWLSYGYLWWVVLANSPKGRGAHLALGAGGQGLAILPACGLVIAQVVDVPGGEERINTQHFLRLINLTIELSRRS